MGTKSRDDVNGQALGDTCMKLYYLIKFCSLVNYKWILKEVFANVSFAYSEIPREISALIIYHAVQSFFLKFLHAGHYEEVVESHRPSI